MLAAWVACVVLIGLLVVIHAFEDSAVARAAIPLACMASGLAFAWVCTDHAWLRDGLTGLAWGVVIIAVTNRWWHNRRAE